MSFMKRNVMDMMTKRDFKQSGLAGLGCIEYDELFNPSDINEDDVIAVDDVVTKTIPPLIKDNSGVTVGEMVKWLEQFPKDGEIWMITSDGLSSPVRELWELNSGDVILEV